MPMKILVTGAAGFAGSHIVDEILRATDADVIGLDSLTYAGHMENLPSPTESRFKFIYHDFRAPLPQRMLEGIGPVDFIIHNGAETHVKTAFENPELFFQSNAVGTMNMLEAARILRPVLFVYVSTDEVFGQSSEPKYEQDALNPSNPYSASKAAGEMLTKAYTKSFRVPGIITRTMNMYGPRQDVEKFIPLCLDRMSRGLDIDIHCNGNGEVGSRQWLHVTDQASALLFLLRHGTAGEIYHIAGERKTNLEVLGALHNEYQKLKGSSTGMLVNAYDLWPGHDLHYCINDDKIRKMGWSPRLTFEQGIKIL